MSETLQLKGSRFGRLIVVAFSGMRKRNDGRNRSYWKCLCDCGKVKILCSRHLVRGTTTSCGCLWDEKNARGLNFKHGEAIVGQLTGEYRSWRNMIDRCTSPKNKSYVNYGGRGIIVCSRWLHSFENFLLDMGRKPTAAHSLERKNNDGIYEPANCKWATAVEQDKNRRKRLRIDQFTGAELIAELDKRGLLKHE